MTKPVLDKVLFERYAELKLAAKKIDAEIKELNPKLREQLEGNGLDEVNHELGKFYFSVTPIWTYPKEIIIMEEALDKAKEVAQQTGEATHEDRKDFKFSPKRD